MSVICPFTYFPTEIYPKLLNLINLGMFCYVHELLVPLHLSENFWGMDVHDVLIT